MAFDLTDRYIQPYITRPSQHTPAMPTLQRTSAQVPRIAMALRIPPMEVVFGAKSCGKKCDCRLIYICIYIYVYIYILDGFWTYLVYSIQVLHSHIPLVWFCTILYNHATLETGNHALVFFVSRSVLKEFDKRGFGLYCIIIYITGNPHSIPSIISYCGLYINPH